MSNRNVQAQDFALNVSPHHQKRDYPKNNKSVNIPDPFIDTIKPAMPVVTSDMAGSSTYAVKEARAVLET